jgi:glucokinase
MEYLVADIGGTNARLATVKLGESKLTDVQVYSASDYPSLEQVVRTYLNEYPQKKVTTACFAVAAPVGHDSVTFTNNPWSFSVESLRKALNLDSLYLINDFEAVAWCLSALKKGDTEELTSDATFNPLKPLAVLGPGTGLGVAGSLLSPSAHRAVLATEGGHSGFAPADDDQLQVWQYLLKKQGFVSREDILCGGGLLRLSEAICAIEGLNINTSFQQPSDITRGALELNDHHCLKVLQLFCAILGNVAGDVALQLGATGGVFIAGGIIPRFIEFFKQSQFMENFLNKGRYRNYLERIPCHVITASQPGLIGAATYCRLKEKA